MKLLKNIFSLIAVLASTMILMTVTAYAGSISDAKEGVVYIESDFYAETDTSFIWDSDTLVGTGLWYDPITSYAYQPGGTTISFRGSGFAIGNNGDPVEYIVTNAHLVLDNTADGIKSLSQLNESMTVNSKKASEVRVYFSYGANDFMRAQIYLVNEEKDICILKLPQTTDKRKSLAICPSSEIDEDDNFAALGFPGSSDVLMDGTSLTYDMSDITVTRGGISRKAVDEDGVSVYQIDIDISGGNSGGPLVNSNGDVVGINTYAVTSNGVSENYAIVIDELISILTSHPEISYATSSAYVSGTSEDGSVNENDLPVARQDTSSNNTVTIVIIVAAAVVIIVVIVVIMSGRSGRSARSRSDKSTSGVIIGIKGVMTGKRIPINDSIVIGRGYQCSSAAQYPINTKGVSEVHCRISKTANGYEIIDLNSSNGTYIGNGQRLTPNVPVLLPNGTYFYLGSPEQLLQIEY